VNMSKTAAIKAAREHVGQIVRRSSTDFTFVGPYRTAEPAGPRTDINASTYPKAQIKRRQLIAAVALHLMGRDPRWVWAQEEPGSLEQIIDEAIRDSVKLVEP
jgi:hypothetical protein